jgi:hypothetical protein
MMQQAMVLKRLELIQCLNEKSAEVVSSLSNDCSYQVERIEQFAQ